MHVIDFGAGAVMRALPSHKRVFGDGWGDPEFLGLLDITQADPPAVVDIQWGRPRCEAGIEIRHGWFASPAAHLPEGAEEAFVLAVGAGAGAAASVRICVLLPAWNDEGYATRRKLAELLTGYGIRSLILEAPLYGSRRIRSRGTPIRTVSDFAVMTRAIVEEGRSLTRWAVHESDVGGVAGYSMGGSLAAAVGASLDFPFALAPLAAAYAPEAVFVDGVLRSAIAWEALGPDAHDRLRKQLALPSVLRVDPTPASRTAVLVGASRDGFVPPAATQAIHDHWPGSELRWVRAGHATMLWRHLDVLAAAVAASFDRVSGNGFAIPCEVRGNPAGS